MAQDRAETLPASQGFCEKKKSFSSGFQNRKRYGKISMTRKRPPLANFKFFSTKDLQNDEKVTVDTLAIKCYNTT